MNPRRLDVEAYRDSLLRAAGVLDEEMGGVPGNLDTRTSYYRRDGATGRCRGSGARRCSRCSIFRTRCRALPDREITVTTLQQIFTMNSPFMQKLAVAAAAKAKAAQGEAEQVAMLYRRILSRTPTAAELESALQYLQKGHTGALRPSAAGDQREDLAAMRRQGPYETITRQMTRREMIEALGGGIGRRRAGDVRLLGSPRRLRPRRDGGHYEGPQLPAKAKHMIMLFMTGGPSQLDHVRLQAGAFKYIGQRPAAVDLRTERPTAGLMPIALRVQALRPRRRGSERAAAEHRERHRRHLRQSIDVHVQSHPHAGSQSLLHRLRAVDAAVGRARGSLMDSAPRTRICRRSSR